MSWDILGLILLAFALGAAIGMVLTYIYGPRMVVHVEDVRETASMVGAVPYRHRHQPAAQPYLEDPGSGLNAHRCTVEGCRASIRVRRPKDSA